MSGVSRRASQSRSSRKTSHAARFSRASPSGRSLTATETRPGCSRSLLAEGAIAPLSFWSNRSGWPAQRRFPALSGPKGSPQRTRLPKTSKLLDLYAEDGMTLDQLMAFTVNPDHERQEQVLCRYRHKTCYVGHAIMPSKVHTTQIRLGDCVTYSA